MSRNAFDIVNLDHQTKKMLYELGFISKGAFVLSFSAALQETFTYIENLVLGLLSEEEEDEEKNDLFRFSSFHTSAKRDPDYLIFFLSQLEELLQPG